MLFYVPKRVKVFYVPKRVKRGKYATLATDTEVNSCFSMY